MSGIDFVADTNAVLYLLSGNICMKPYLEKKLGVSVIAVMELLSFPDIKIEEETKIRAFLNNCVVLDLNSRVRETTISLRRTYRKKLPDTIIAATAIEAGVPIITADTGFFNITELSVEKIVP